MRLRTGYLDEQADDARRGARDHRAAATKAKKPMSVGLLGNAAEILPELVRRGVRPDVVTDQTSRARSGQRLSADGLDARRVAKPSASSDPKAVEQRRASTRWRVQVARDAGLPRRRACRRSTTATTSARWRRTRASTNAFDFPGFVPAYIRPLFCRGIGPFRWAALSGDPEDIYKHRRQGEGADARRHAPAPLARHGARAHHVPGPAGAHLLGRPRRPPPPRPRLQRDGGAAAS